MFWDLTNEMATQFQLAQEDTVSPAINTTLPLTVGLHSLYETDLQTLNLRCGTLELSLDNKRKNFEEMEPFPRNNIRLVKQILRVIPASQTVAPVGKTQFSCAPGKTATPLRLLIGVWFNEAYDAERIKNLALIIHDYEVIYTTTQRVIKHANRDKFIEFESLLDQKWFFEAMRCIAEHINWLRLSLEKELQKPSDDLRLPPIPQVRLNDEPMPPVSINDMNEQIPSHVVFENMEGAVPQRPSAPAPPDEDHVGSNSVYELEANSANTPMTWKTHPSAPLCQMKSESAEDQSQSSYIHDMIFGRPVKSL